MSPPPSEVAALVKVSEITGRGRALVASRPIKAGEVILSDSPVLLYPTASASCCFRCFRTLTNIPASSSSSSSSCRKCSSPFCSPRCLSQESHPPFACQALSHLRARHFPPDFLTELHFLIAAYSLVPSDLHRLLSLSGSTIAGNPSSDLHSALLPPPSGFSHQLTAALLAVDRANAFGIMEPFDERRGDHHHGVRAYGIYPTASLFNHDCLPNACRFDYFDNLDGGRNTDIVVRAIHDIPEGREVCLSYFPVKWSYKDRQRRLAEDYGFHCVCDRCEVERNWKDDDQAKAGVDGMEEEGEDGDADFPHAYFFMRYVCERDSCGGTLAPLPPTHEGVLSDMMECNVCGRVTREEDSDGGGDVDGDGDDAMLEE